MADQVDIKGKLEAKVGADLGNPLVDGGVKFEDHHYEAAKQFLSEDLPYYAQRVSSLVGRPEAAEFFAWMKEQAKDEDNTLFQILMPQEV